MVVFDIKRVPVHAGSIRFYVAKKDSKRAKVVSKNVKLLEKEEKIKGYNKLEFFKLFSKKVNKTKVNLVNFLRIIKKEGKIVAGYGASGRANTIIQYCGITNDLISYMIDDAPAKIGCFTPGSHLKILPSSVLNSKNAPDYILIFAWSFLKEIVKRNKEYIKKGGKIIVPLPKVKIVNF